jgi:putative ABC transport system substrate-binding protein
VTPKHPPVPPMDLANMRELEVGRNLMQIGQTNRRTFIAGLGGTAAFPLAAHAQTERTRRIGALMGFSENDAEGQVRVAAFRRQLQELGWSEDHNLQIDFRFVGGDVERMRPAAAELVALTPDVIFVQSNPGVAALRQVNRAIPAVFAQVADPVGSGFIDSLAHPGGNMTGFTNFEAEIGGKWLEILKEVAPTVTRAVVLLHMQTAANVAFLRAVETASTSLGITVTSAGVQDAAEIASAFETFAAPDSGLLVMPHFVTVSNRHRLGSPAPTRSSSDPQASTRPADDARQHAGLAMVSWKRSSRFLGGRSTPALARMKLFKGANQ